jgi:hypothetical protein
LSPRALKASWHLLAAGLHLVEAVHIAKTPFTKQVAGACFGFHLLAFVVDVTDKEATR